MAQNIIPEKWRGGEGGGVRGGGGGGEGEGEGGRGVMTSIVL